MALLACNSDVVGRGSDLPGRVLSEIKRRSLDNRSGATRLLGILGLLIDEWRIGRRAEQRLSEVGTEARGCRTAGPELQARGVDT